MNVGVNAHRHEHVSSRRVLVALAVTVVAAMVELAGAAGGKSLFLS